MASRPSPPRPRRGNPLATIGWAGILLLFGLVLLVVWLFNAPKTLDYSDVLLLAKKGKIEKVTFVGNDRLEGEIKPSEMDSEDVKALGLTRKEFQAEIVGANNQKFVELL